MANSHSSDNLSLEKQKTIIMGVLKESQEMYSSYHDAISEFLKTLSEANSMKKLTKQLNQFLYILDEHKHKELLAFYKKKGLYRMLYHHPKTKGIEDTSGLKNLIKGGFIGVAVSTLITAGFITSMVLGAPVWLTAIASGLFVGAGTYISGLLYGIVNDLFATRFNLPYFLLGHQPQQHSLLKTNDKTAQGVAWGVAATYPLAAIAAGIFAIASTITAFFALLATFVLPIMVIAMPLIAIGAEFYAKRRAKKLEGRLFFQNAGSNEYQINGLKYMSGSKEDTAKWFANSDRNLFGFKRVPIIGLGALVATIVLSAISKFLPAFLFASLSTVILPVSFIGAAIAAITALGIYAYKRRNYRIDNRYNLDFENDEPNYNLYLDEDKDYARKLLSSPQKENTKISEKRNSMSNSEKPDVKVSDHGLYKRKPGKTKKTDEDFEILSDKHQSVSP